jgi:hypothetical protein
MRLSQSLKRVLTSQSGQALPMAMVLLIVGGLVIVPLLNFITGNMKASQVMEDKVYDFYAADAGAEDGLWKVRYDYLPDWLMGDWTEETYSHEPYSYTMYDNDNPSDITTVNGREVAVEIKPTWVLQDLEEPSTQQGRTPDDRLITYGNKTGETPDKSRGIYTISIMYDGSLGTLLVQRIGCWLPAGFDYVEGSSNLEQAPGQPYYKVPQTFSHKSGTAVVWDYSSGIDYNDLPSSGTKKIVTFRFTPNKDMLDAFSWTRTNSDQIKLSWDTSKKIIEITSRAPSGESKQTTVTCHVIKKEFQPLGSALNGDYAASGITLMRDHDNDQGYWSDRDRRERLYKETAVTIGPGQPVSVPEDATVERIFLYWSGWKCKPWNIWGYSQQQRNQLPSQKNINKVNFRVKVGTTEFQSIVTASVSQVLPDGTSSSPHGWSYSCFADVTNQVVDFFKARNVPFYGNGTYTVGHWDVSPNYNSSTYRYALYNWKDNHQNETIAGYTRYPLGSPMDGRQRDSGYENDGEQDEWSHAAWSVIIIYSSPSTLGHHLYLYDEFRTCVQYGTISFTIRGFLAPDDVASDPQAARMTVFVGEGDYHYTGDRFQVNNVSLSDQYNPQDNVWNGISNVLGQSAPSHEGIDIDTFIAGGGDIIKPGDTEAQIRMPTSTDVWHLVYIILSFRSEITVGGVIDFKVE